MQGAERIIMVSSHSNTLKVTKWDRPYYAKDDPHFLVMPFCDTFQLTAGQVVSKAELIAMRDEITRALSNDEK
jgi:hypothetical protein